MFLRRAATSLTLSPLAIGLIYLGEYYLFIPYLIFVLIAAAEFSQIVTRLNVTVPRNLLVGVVAIQLIVAQLLSQAQHQATMQLHGMTFLALSLIILAWAIARYERTDSTRVTFDWLVTMGGFFLLGWLASHLTLLRNLEPGTGSEYWRWTAVSLIAAWLADTFAYLVGSFLAGRGPLGRHSLTPRLSPKKTVEGFFGGVILGTMTTTLFGIYLFQLDGWIVFWLSFLLTTLGTLGDLSISLLKRDATVKDSGVLFPGHGGALDRTDSLVWSVAIAYYFLYFVNHVLT